MFGGGGGGEKFVINDQLQNHLVFQCRTISKIKFILYCRLNIRKDNIYATLNDIGSDPFYIDFSKN